MISSTKEIKARADKRRKKMAEELIMGRDIRNVAEEMGVSEKTARKIKDNGTTRLLVLQAFHPWGEELGTLVGMAIQVAQDMMAKKRGFETRHAGATLAGRLISLAIGGGAQINIQPGVPLAEALLALRDAQQARLTSPAGPTVEVTTAAVEVTTAAGVPLQDALRAIEKGENEC